MPVIITDKSGNVFVLAGIRDLSYSPATGLTTSPNTETLCTGAGVRVRNRGDDVVELMLSAQAEISQSASRSKSESRRRSRSRSASKYPSRSRWKSRSKSRSRLQSLSQSVSKSGSRSVSVSMSLSKSESRFKSESKSQSKTKSKSKSKSGSRSVSVSLSLSKSESRERSLSKSRSQSVSKSISKSQSKSVSRSQSVSKSQSKSVSLSQSKSASKSASRSKSESRSASVSRSKSKSKSKSASISLSKSKSRSRENLWYCVNRQVYEEECVGATESETRMCVRGKDIISECTISEGPPVRFTIDVVVDGPYTTEGACLASCISGSRSRSISKEKLPQNTCNDCVPRIPDTLYVEFSGLGGDFAPYDKTQFPGGKIPAEWVSACIWVAGTLSEPGGLYIENTGYGWELFLQAAVSQCAMMWGRPDETNCTPGGAYTLSICDDGGCTDPDSCEKSAGATAEVSLT